MASALALLASLVFLFSPIAHGGCPFQQSNAIFGKSITAKTEWWNKNRFSAPSSCTAKQYETIAWLIRRQGRNIGPPNFLRLGFHAGGSTSAQDRSVGGVNGGWLQFPQDRYHPNNNGLDPTIDALLDIKQAYPCITFADLCSFGGAIATEMDGKGPAIAWHPGRKDALHPGPTTPPHSQKLPDGMFNAAGVLYWGATLGLTIREIVVFVGGGHSFGGMHMERTGWSGRFTPFGVGWPKPDNKYFLDSVNAQWMVDSQTQVDPPERLQFVPIPGQESKNISYVAMNDNLPIIRLPSDMAFIQNVEFRRYLKLYARDAALFRKDFARVMQRYLQMGVKHGYELGSYTWKGFKGTAVDYGKDIYPLN